jgi:hypothetical protein
LKRRERVEVDGQLAADELSDLEWVGEATKVALDDALDASRHRHLVCVVQVEVTVGYIALPGVPARMPPQGRDPVRCDAEGLKSG